MSNIYDLVILGGGAAGLTAGIHALRSGLKTVLIERLMLGGQIINADIIENYPGFPTGITGPDLATALQEQASDLAIEYAFGSAVSLKTDDGFLVVGTESEKFTTKSVIIAIGGDPNTLGIPGEKELEAQGVSSCATCDGYFFTGQEVVVIGGGDTAIDEATYLSTMCSKITVIHRRDQLRASKLLQERAFNNPKVTFVFDTVVESINGDATVDSVTLCNVQTGERQTLPTSGVFISIGVHPSTQLFENLLTLDTGGHIVVDVAMATNVPGVFAAGVCRSGTAGQLANIIGDGATAAWSAQTYLETL